MNRIHAAVITLIVGGAVAVGGVALSQSGADAIPQAPSTSTVDDQTLAQRAAGLDALEASLDTQEAAPATATPKTITVQAKAPGTLSQRDDDNDQSDKRYDDDSGEEPEGDDD